EDTADDEAEAIFQTNSMGVLRVCCAVLPIMREQGTGRIVVVSSIAGRVAVPFQGLYSATKFAVEGLCEALRMEVKRFGIHVTLVEPGDFHTGFTDRRLRVRASRENGAYSEACRRALEIAESDERRASTPEGVARLVSRILSRRAPRLRYTVGPALQRVAVRLKSVLPSQVFEWALGLYYRA
ncbi:MAG: SDR family NAD(P)-dependent oxidoreductase, partial [Thermotogota bacterium]